MTMSNPFSTRTLPLIDGNDIPQLCLRSFHADSTQQTKEIVKSFYAVGIRHFEICELFGNAHTVCEALREVSINRSELYITLKLWPKCRRPEDIIAACSVLLAEVGLEYVDLVTLHAPLEADLFSDQWKALEDLKDSNLAKSLGCVNLSSPGLTELLKNCRTAPAVVEIEVTPFDTKHDLTEYCSDGGIVILNNEPTAKSLRHAQLSALTSMHPDLLLLRIAANRGHCIGLSPHTLPLLQGCAERVVFEEVGVGVEVSDEGLGTAWVPVQVVEG